MPRGKRNERLHSSLNWGPASGLSLLHKREELLHTQTCTGSGEETKARQASSSTNTASHPRHSYSFTSFINTLSSSSSWARPWVTSRGTEWTGHTCELTVLCDKGWGSSQGGLGNSAEGDQQSGEVRKGQRSLQGGPSSRCTSVPL